ncbi:flagellin [Alicyclobacillus sp. SO9]|uniref:flagellin N-terminal helical domain-containing protein n=1 Tax=Alicyclobacillus sp. SO9 TaxID=2665646 RepID=UPI0018E78C9C|nr:flagellin [Alicyclobacillus sp. SO9]QQE78115.1 flagellin [Alicyclobacillus sp. SO9]
MRVTDGMMTQQFLYNITNIHQRLQSLEMELSTGKSLNKPSDNPVQVSNDMAIRSIISETQGYQNTISSALSWMNNTSGAMQQISSALQSIQSNVLEALNGTSKSTGTIQALYQNVKQSISRVYQTLDTRQGSQYLFGGTDTSTQPSVSAKAGTASQGTIKYQVASSTTLSINVTAYSIMLQPPNAQSASLKDTLNSILADMKAPNLSNLQGDLANLQSNMKHVTNLNAGVGARIRRATALQNQFTQYATTMTNQKGVIEGADMAKVITQFNTDQNVFTAALKMGSKVLLPTLMSFLPNG